MIHLPCLDKLGLASLLPCSRPEVCAGITHFRLLATFQNVGLLLIQGSALTLSGCAPHLKVRRLWVKGLCPLRFFIDPF